MMMDLIEPTLLLDKAKCLENIRCMTEKAQRGVVTLRPHFKTHQSHEIGRWFRAAGVDKITVSSIKMAEYFAADGWKDITVAFPVNIHEIDRINALAEMVTLNLLAVSADPLEHLAKRLQLPVNLLIEIDCGDHRTGIDPAGLAAINKIIFEIEYFKLMTFKGFLTHAGQSYAVKSDRESIAEIYRQSTELIAPLRAHYIERYPDLTISYGDTPTCSVTESFEGIDELRPGNFAFYDLMQTRIGACTADQVAVAMACPVVAKYPERGEFVVYGGGVHFSKDFILMPDGARCYGQMVRLTDDGWETAETGAFLKSLSQEHGVVSAPPELLKEIEIGDFVGFLPVHSCLTADVMKSYLTLDGEKISMFDGRSVR